MTSSSGPAKVRLESYCGRFYHRRLGCVCVGFLVDLLKLESKAGVRRQSGLMGLQRPDAFSEAAVL